MAQPVWNTPAGSLGVYPANIALVITLSATAQAPANNITYTLISGSLPPGTSLSPIAISSTGIITGIPAIVFVDTVSVFTIRATDGLGNIRDRTFSIAVSGVSNPAFTTPEGNILSTVDSTWVDYSVEYSNPNPNNQIRIELAQGSLPPGLELSPTGTIRGYARPPTGGEGSPTTRTYQFVLSLTNDNAGVIVSVSYASYSITISNHSLTNPPNTRRPVILNNRPLTLVPSPSDPFYGYYITVNTVFIGTFQSDNYFAFKLIGYDFDGDNLSYSFANLPLGLTGDSSTGWINGTPVLNTDSISQYSFSVRAEKASNTSINSGYLTFTLNVAKNINETIVWITPSDLGTIFNGSVSTLNVKALASVNLEYRLVSGEFPPNTVLLSSGEITGRVAQQPASTLKIQGETTTFSATVQAFSPEFPLITTTRTFNVTVLQEYAQPFETLYIQAAPSLNDRNIVRTLLDNTTLIPNEVLYRPFDIYFGKATSIIYEHAFGIYASDLNQYLTTITRNHYWRYITLGELKTAIARNSNGDIVYEVVYSEVIDNLVNPQGVSIPSSIIWPRQIDLNQGPWYTSMTDIFTSYSFEQDGQPTFYTSLSPGYVKTLYPNSLYNMRNRVASILGQEQDSRLLPLWMTSQQLNGSTLGYTQAWVIAYTKPGIININGDLLTYAEFEATGLSRTRVINGETVTVYFSSSETIKNNINALWPYKLNDINFEIDRFSVDKSTTYNYDNTFQPPAWTGLPSADPTPDPLDSKNFYVLFPRQTILPKQP